MTPSYGVIISASLEAKMISTRCLPLGVNIPIPTGPITVTPLRQLKFLIKLFPRFDDKLTSEALGGLFRYCRWTCAGCDHTNAIGSRKCSGCREGFVDPRYEQILDEEAKDPTEALEEMIEKLEEKNNLWSIGIEDPMGDTVIQIKFDALPGWNVEFTPWLQEKLPPVATMFVRRECVDEDICGFQMKFPHWEAFTEDLAATYTHAIDTAVLPIVEALSKTHLLRSLPEEYDQGDSSQLDLEDAAAILIKEVKKLRWNWLGSSKGHHLELKLPNYKDFQLHFTPWMGQACAMGVIIDAGDEDILDFQMEFPHWKTPRGSLAAVFVHILETSVEPILHTLSEIDLAN